MPFGEGMQYPWFHNFWLKVDKVASSENLFFAMFFLAFWEDHIVFVLSLDKNTVVHTNVKTISGSM